jgi:hypothetical protein
MDVFEEAKSRSLVQFLEEQLRITGRQHGRRVGFKSCPQCRESRKGNEKVSVLDDRFWTCFACGAGGTIVDAAMHLFDVREPLDAANLVVGRAKAARLVQPLAQAPQRDLSAVREVIQRLWQCSRRHWEPQVSAYLEGRAIAQNVIAEAWQRGILGSMPAEPQRCADWLAAVCGEDLLRKAELWSADKRRPWPSYRQLLVFAGGMHSCELRTIHAAQPGDKSYRKSLSIGTHAYPVFWTAKGTASSCLVVEGVIDLLSAVTLGYPGHIMMLAGVTCWRPEWIAAAQRTHRITLFEIGLDNDVDHPLNSGQAAAQRLIDVCAQLGVRSRNVSPRAGDINDWLVAKRRSKLPTGGAHAALA